MEACSNKNDIGRVYRIVRTLRGKHKKRPANVMSDDEGNLITNTTAKQTQ